MVLDWIRKNTDHKTIDLHEVERHRKSYRGGFKRIAIPIGMYSGEVEIITKIFYGHDLSEDWKRLVIVKEALHVFDGANECVNDEASLRQLIPSVVANDSAFTQHSMPALADKFGPYRALCILIPKQQRELLKEAVESNKRSVSEVADFVGLPVGYVDIWLRYGDTLEEIFLA